jgi:hypothetical protein
MRKKPDAKGAVASLRALPGLGTFEANQVCALPAKVVRDFAGFSKDPCHFIYGPAFAWQSETILSAS